MAVDFLVWPRKTLGEWEASLETAMAEDFQAFRKAVVEVGAVYLEIQAQAVQPEPHRARVPVRVRALAVVGSGVRCRVQAPRRTPRPDRAHREVERHRKEQVDQILVHQCRISAAEPLARETSHRHNQVPIVIRAAASPIYLESKLNGWQRTHS